MGFRDHVVHPFAPCLYVLPSGGQEGTLRCCLTVLVQKSQGRLGIGHDGQVDVVAVTDLGGPQVNLDSRDFVVDIKSAEVVGAHQDQEIGIGHGLIGRLGVQLAHLAQGIGMAVVDDSLGRHGLNEGDRVLHHELLGLSPGTLGADSEEGDGPLVLGGHGQGLADVGLVDLWLAGMALVGSRF